MTEEDKLYPDLTQIDGIPDPSPTHRIKVSKLPQKTTEEGLKYFFENRKMFGGCNVETVDYDPATSTAVVIFKETDDVERILRKMPILFEDTSINIERHYIEEEAEDNEYNECTIEVTGMSQKTTQQNIEMYFESKKGADADVLLVAFKEEDEMYLVKFESETVVDAVLNKRHILDGSELQVRRHIPFQAESTYPNQVVISGLDIKTTHDSLRNFLQARSKTDVNKIMYGEIDGTAIIVFKTQPDIEKLKEECKRRQLDGCYLRVDTVPVSKCIIVSNIKEGTSKDAVLFYFDNKKKSGVEGVSNVDLNTKDRTCIVHFLDTEDKAG